jgi:streptomycin 6-kinase
MSEVDWDSVFGPWLARWALVPVGAAMATRGSRLLPVRRGDVAAMLKIALEPEERTGAALMTWWAGEGAALVLAHEGDALLLERASGARSLADMAQQGQDDEASRILCVTAARLHEARASPTPALVPLERWFAELAPAAARHGGILLQSARVARTLLASPQEIRVLHGDLHHGNVLDAGPRGWLAIDPKGLLGERGFDFANIFCNPDHATATTPGRLARQASVVATAAGLEQGRLLRWILAYAGLSAAWTLNEGRNACTALAVARLATAEIGVAG